MRSPAVIRLVLAACALVLVAGACASTPKKKAPKKRTVLMTSYDDSRVGEKASVDVSAQIGVLDDPELAAYLTEIGRKLLRALPRRSFQYHFAVVDQTEPNAFALPGGYIFVSRGLLALATNEDELACVLGHEIVHVHHRHAAAQQDLGSRGIAMPWVRAGKNAAYGRDMERDADRGGQILCAAAGYDPMGMSTFLASLRQAERLQLGYARNPGFFDSHPGSSERAAVNAVRASEMRWRRDPLLGETQRSLYAKIEGLPVGQRPETGVFRGDLFLHPALDFQIRFPRGWSTSNSNQAVGASAPRGEAIVFLTADAPRGEPRKIAEQWAEKTRETQPIEIQAAKHVKVGDLDAWRIQVGSSSGAGRLSSLITFIPYREATWRITGMSRASQAESFQGRTLSTTRSFRPLDPAARASIVSKRLVIVEARSGESLEGLSQRTGNSWDLAQLALYNRVFVDHRFRGGELVKVVQDFPYVPVTPPALPAKQPVPPAGSP
jgi:predicted Zn-dependent protease